MIIIVSYLKVLIKRSTHLPLTEKITHWLEGDYKKELWKVALEPEGRTSSVTGGMQISIRGQDSKLSRDPTLKGNEVCIRL